MAAVINKMTAMILQTCAEEKCGVEFAVTEGYNDRRREDGKTFYCPNAHPLSYRLGKSDAEKLKEANAARELAEARLREAGEHNRRELARVNKKVAALVKRAHDGVCPLCPRTISPSRMTRHIETKHKGQLV